MVLWHFAQDNGAQAPWEIENKWVFDGYLHLNSWTLGFEYWDGASSLHLGPLHITFWKAK